MCSSSIALLPVELLSTIAELSVERHLAFGYVIDSAPLSALSLVNRTFYDIAFPILFREIPITSEYQLDSLSRSKPKYLAKIRELSIFLDADFFESCKFWGFVRNGSGPPGCSSPFDCLAKVLSNTPQLEHLRMRIASRTSTWDSLYKRPFAIPLSDALMRSRCWISLPHLKSLELDCFGDLHKLLATAPNLRTLRLRVSGGFPEDTNHDLLRALTYVPDLEELSYTPSTLRMKDFGSRNGGGDEAGVAGGVWDEDGFWHEPGDGSVLLANPNVDEEREARAKTKLVEEIGKALPRLRFLDLQARWFTGKGTTFVIANELVSAPHLIEVIQQHLPNLCSLALPGTVAGSSLARREQPAIMRALNAFVPEALQLIDSREYAGLISGQESALRTVIAGEQEAVEGVLMKPHPRELRSAQTSQSQLTRISFTRPDNSVTGDMELRSITYIALPYCPEGELVLYSGTFSTSWTRQKSRSAAYNQVDAYHPVQRSLKHLLRTIRIRVRRSIATSTGLSNARAKPCYGYGRGLDFWLALLDPPLSPPLHGLSSSTSSQGSVVSGNEGRSQPYRSYSELSRASSAAGGALLTASLALGTIGGRMMGRAALDAGFVGGGGAPLWGGFLAAGAVAAAGNW